MEIQILTRVQQFYQRTHSDTTKRSNAGLARPSRASPFHQRWSRPPRNDWGYGPPHAEGRIYTALRPPARRWWFRVTHHLTLKAYRKLPITVSSRRGGTLPGSEPLHAKGGIETQGCGTTIPGFLKATILMVIIKRLDAQLGNPIKSIRWGEPLQGSRCVLDFCSRIQAA